MKANLCVSDDKFEAVSQRDHLLFHFSSLTFCPRPFHPDFDKKSTCVLRSKHGSKPRQKKSQTDLGHPIRIVPLHRPEAAAAVAQAAPQLTYRNGPLLTAVQVFTIFWGSAWRQPPQSDFVQRVNQFFDFILTSALLDQLAEYEEAG